jgi:hypothetical protein
VVSSGFLFLFVVFVEEQEITIKLSPLYGAGYEH